MATLHLFRLIPQGGFHFGTAGIGAEVTSIHCPSDTLWSALYAEAHLARRPFPQPDANGHLSDPPWRLSSCFPYAGTALLFPIPSLRPARREEPGQGMRKRIKGIRYVSVTILRHLLAGGSVLDFVDEVGHVGQAYQDGIVLITTADAPTLSSTTLWKEDRVDHVTVDRAREQGAYYAVGQVRFADRCGLYILAQTRDAAATTLLHEHLSRLGHSGLGGRRSAGLGQFDVATPEEIDLPSTNGHTRAMLLSRYLPSIEELTNGVLGDGAAYDLVRVGGWLQSNDTRTPAQRRKTIDLLAEGSVVRCMEGAPPRGKVVDVAPDNVPFAHPVWRYGLALTLGIGAEEQR